MKTKQKSISVFNTLYLFYFSNNTGQAQYYNEIEKYSMYDLH